MIKVSAVSVLISTAIALGGMIALDVTGKSGIEHEPKQEVEVFTATGKLIETFTGKSVDVQTKEEKKEVIVIIDGSKYSFYNATVVLEGD